MQHICAAQPSNALADPAAQRPPLAGSIVASTALAGAKVPSRRIRTYAMADEREGPPDAVRPLRPAKILPVSTFTATAGQ